MAKRDRDSASNNGSDDDQSMPDTIQVDFDFFGVREIDFHAIKRLLSVLFGVADAQNLPLSEMTERILAQKSVGTTVKCDGEESDPYALLTAIPLDVEGEYCKALNALIESKCPKDQKERVVASALKKHNLFLFNERLINMPPQIAPPMFRMLKEEIASEGILPKYDYFVYIYKEYREVDAEVDVPSEDSPKQQPPKKKKKQATNQAMHFFNAEDQVLKQHAEFSFNYKPPKTDSSRVTDAMRVFSDFGIDEERCVMFIKCDKLEKLADAVSAFLPHP